MALDKANKPSKLGRLSYLKQTSADQFVMLIIFHFISNFVNMSTDPDYHCELLTIIITG